SREITCTPSQASGSRSIGAHCATRTIRATTGSTFRRARFISLPAMLPFLVAPRPGGGPDPRRPGARTAPQRQRAGGAMDFEATYTEEQQRFRREVRAWLEANVPSSVQRTPVSAEDNYQRYLELRSLGRKLGAKGWLYPTAPAKYGGGGLDVDHAII